jgi:hypothetical protein
MDEGISGSSNEKVKFHWTREKENIKGKQKADTENDNKYKTEEEKGKKEHGQRPRHIQPRKLALSLQIYIFQK